MNRLNDLTLCGKNREMLLSVAELLKQIGNVMNV